MLLAATLFALSNYTVSDMGQLGFGLFYYWGSGMLLLCVVYFIWYYKKLDNENRDFYDKQGKRRYVWTNQDCKVDWELILVYIGGGFMQFLVISTINLTLICSKKAELNIGISSAIWALNPFFVSLWDFLLNNTPL